MENFKSQESIRMKHYRLSLSGEQLEKSKESNRERQARFRQRQREKKEAATTSLTRAEIKKRGEAQKKYNEKM